MRINLPKTFSQIGNQTPIGNSNIDKIGCLTVDAAMAATHFGRSIDPSNLAKSVTYAFNGPNNTGVRTLWDWNELHRLYPEIVYKGQIATPGDLTDGQMNQIRDIINNGFPVFILIKTPTIPEHWLLAIDYNGDDFICADPLKANGTPHPITDYGIAPKKVIYAYAWYSGPVGQQPGQPQPGGDYYKGYDLTNKDSMKVAVDQMVKIINGEYVEKGAFEQYKAAHPVSTSEQAEKDKQTKTAIDKMTTDLLESGRTIETQRKEIENLKKNNAEIVKQTTDELKARIITNLFKA